MKHSVDISLLQRFQGPLGCGPNSGTVSAYAADRPAAVRDIRLGEPEGTQILLSGDLIQNGDWIHGQDSN